MTAKTNFKADAHRNIQHIFIKDLELMAVIGVYDHEKNNRQRVVANIDITVQENPDAADEIDEVVCYHKVVKKIQSICENGHVHLLETLAETIAESCLEDKRILAIRVKLEKPEALREAASVGVEIERLQKGTKD
ncbi:MAG: dihydroneopterin aldolase [Rhizobiales bacterium]|nr:dihydroneopterin aldolase [Hyphomicrobiales bacterium]